VSGHPRTSGHLRPPDAEDLARAARRERLPLSAADCEELVPFAADFVRAFDAVEDLPDVQVPTAWPRTPGRQPTPEEDPVNAFVRLTEIRGAENGPLAGRRVGIKDNIAVAGVPLTNGSRSFSYTPVQDAVVVERVLAAGGVIAGKLNLDDFSASGFGDTSVFGAASINARRRSAAKSRTRRNATYSGADSRY